MLHRLAEGWLGGDIRRKPSSPCLEAGTTLHTEGTEGGGEDGDDEVDDGFPIYFHDFLFVMELKEAGGEASNPDIRSGLFVDDKCAMIGISGESSDCP